MKDLLCIYAISKNVYNVRNTTILLATGIDRFEMLADYLHVTVSQLLGEETKKEPDGENAVELPDPLDAQLMDLLRRADPETKSAMLVLLQQRKKDE